MSSSTVGTSAAGTSDHLRWTETVLLAGLLGVFVPYAFEKAQALLLPNASLTVPTELLAVAWFYVVGRRLGRPGLGTGRRASHVWVGVYAGIAIGVVVWSALEDLVFRHIGNGMFPIYEEHTLFPFEILILWLVAAIPLALGMWVARRAARAAGEGEEREA